jgi:hypothetical protein
LAARNNLDLVLKAAANRDKPSVKSEATDVLEEEAPRRRRSMEQSLMHVLEEEASLWLRSLERPGMLKDIIWSALFLVLKINNSSAMKAQKVGEGNSIVLCAATVKIE